MSEEPDNEQGLTAQWPTMAAKVLKVDEDKVQDCKEDIDTLMVFAGLFSAVTSAFLIESYKQLQPDQGDINNSLLAQILLAQLNLTNFPINASTLTCIAESSCNSPSPSTSAKRVNILWFASLILSLVTASFGMLVKQWLREFMAGEYTSPRARLRIHLFRYPGLIRWKVFEMVAILPLLLQLSLALFFTGLCFFAFSVHKSIGWTTISLVGLWMFLFIIATLSPLFSPRCPYKTMFVKWAMKALRKRLANSFSSISEHYKQLSKFNAMDIEKSTSRDLPQPFEEESFAEDAKWKDDLEILLAVDTMQVDDELFCTTMASLVKQKPTLARKSAERQVFDFIVKFIQNRSEMHLSLEARPVLHGHFTYSVWSKVVEIVADLLIGDVSSLTPTSRKWDYWMEGAVTILLSFTEHQLPGEGVTGLACAFRADPVQMAQLVNNRTPFPDWANDLSKLDGTKTDVFAELVMREIKGVLPLVHGQALLDCILQLIRCRFAVQVSNILEFFENNPIDTIPLPTSHQNSTSNNSTSPSQRPIFYVSSNGCLKITLDLLIEDIDRVFSGPYQEGNQSVKEACTIVLALRHWWTNEQLKRIEGWLKDSRSLDWCFMFAFTLDDNKAHMNLSGLMRRALLDHAPQLSIVAFREMVDSVTDVLRIRNASAALMTQDSEPSLDFCHMCEFLLEILYRGLSKPGPTSKAERRDYNGFLNSLQRLDLPFANFAETHKVASSQYGTKMAEDCTKLHKLYNDVVSTISNGKSARKLDHIYAALCPERKAADKWLQNHSASKSG